MEQAEIRGEFCIVLEGNEDAVESNEETPWWSELTLEEHVDHLIEEKQCTSKEAIKEVAIQRGLSKREVYQNYHVE